MMLSELSPRLIGRLEDGILWFDCPWHGHSPQQQHRVRVAISREPYHVRAPREADIPDRDGKVKVWQGSAGGFPATLTLVPRINIVKESGGPLCWHGHITQGEIR